MGLKDQLKGVIPDYQLRFLSDRFDVVGDIAILSLPAELNGYGNAIAAAIMSRRRMIKTVLNKTSPLTGSRRTAGYAILAGTSTVTTYREYGFSYQLDITRVFFNPRLCTERMRVTRQVQGGETVLVPFCGVGPFVIPAAAQGAKVTAIELNAEACCWLGGNCRLNKVDPHVTILQADAFDSIPSSLSGFDRAIIPTPYGRDAILDRITPLVRPGGTIHFYTFRKQYQIAGLVREYRDQGFEVLYSAACGNIAPGVSRWVFDLMKP